MKNKEIVSAVLGSAFFAIPYLGLSIALAPSLVIGCAAFGASELVFSGVKVKEKLKDTNRPLYLKISTAKKQNKEILNLIPKVENIDTRKNLNEIHDTVNEVLDVVENNPKKAGRIDNFFDYYLPVLIKIVNRYDLVDAMIDGVLPKPIYRTAYIELFGLQKLLEDKINTGKYTKEEYLEYKKILQDVKRRLEQAPGTKELILNNIKKTKIIFKI